MKNLFFFVNSFWSGHCLKQIWQFACLYIYSVVFPINRKLHFPFFIYQLFYYRPHTFLLDKQIALCTQLSFNSVILTLYVSAVFRWKHSRKICCFFLSTVFFVVPGHDYFSYFSFPFFFNFPGPSPLLVLVQLPSRTPPGKINFPADPHLHNGALIKIRLDFTQLRKIGSCPNLRGF